MSVWRTPSVSRGKDLVRPYNLRGRVCDSQNGHRTMDTSRRDQISRLYYEALERPAAERAGFIKEACKGDTSLQHELESLLRYATAAARFLVTPAPALAATARKHPELSLLRDDTHRDLCAAGTHQRRTCGLA